MTAPRKKYTKSEDLPQIAINERVEILNYEEARVAHRPMDKFTIKMNDGEEYVVYGHEVAMSISESERANLPIYQIIEYVPVMLDVRLQTTHISGNALTMKREVIQEEQTISIEDTTRVEYVKTAKAILWPGTYSTIIRELGTSIDE